jgi:hypothetical protein
VAPRRGGDGRGARSWRPCVGNAGAHACDSINPVLSWRRYHAREIAMPWSFSPNYDITITQPHPRPALNQPATIAWQLRTLSEFQGLLVTANGSIKPPVVPRP